MLLVLRPRPSLLHCSFCREHLPPGEGQTCACGVLLHTECWPQLKRCPTLGCAQRRPVRVSLGRVSATARRRRAAEQNWVGRAALFGLGLVPVLGVLFLGLVSSAVTGDPLSPVGIAVLAPFVCGAVSMVSWLREKCGFKRRSRGDVEQVPA